MNVGDRVLVDIDREGWVPGAVTGQRASTDVREDFSRGDVALDDGRRIAGCHPDCVQAADEVTA